MLGSEERDDLQEGRRSVVRPAIMIAAALLLGWLIASPFFALNQVRDAAKRGDSDALSRLVDFPSVRQHLKDEMNAVVAGHIRDDMKDNPFGALGALLAGSLVDRFVDTMITPSAIAQMTRGQRSDAASDSSALSSEAKIHVRQGYSSPNAFRAMVSVDGGGKPIWFDFERRGLGWVLIAIDVPTDSSGVAR